MVALWIIIGLVIATVGVSTLGAAFSVVGIGALFSGALIAVYAMSASLEFAKFVLAAYLHQRWNHLNIVFKYYLATAVVVLSCITSMGIFGFLSDAYQSASTAIEAENIKITNLKTQKVSQENEIARLNRSIEEIPETRISKKLKARAEAEPLIAAMTKKIDVLESQIGQSNLNMLEVKKKVGPLIYIAKAFNMEIDAVVKYFIILFVSVFDPLAICLVIATSEALDSRKKALLAGAGKRRYASEDEESSAEENSEPQQQQENKSGTKTEADVIEMRFADDKDRNAV